MVTECGADVNQTNNSGTSLLLHAVAENDIEASQFDGIRYLVRTLGADVNQTGKQGVTPLMVAASKNMVQMMVRTVSTVGNTAITLLRAAGASAEQIAYLEVRASCANPGCAGGGVKRCAVCKETRYCGKPCQVANWPVHRVGCRPPPDVTGSGGAP
jgi:hypothetical protein